MAIKLSATEFARNLSEYLNRVLYRGESFVILRSNRPVGELRPIPAGTRMGDLPDILASLPHLSRREAEQMGREIEGYRSELDSEPVGDAWASS